MRLPFNKKQLAMAVALAATVVVPVQADDVEPSNVTLEELVVTAQKREQNMQDTPISMAAFNTEAMEKQGINDISDAAQYMPNVMVAESPGGSTGATIGIRGSVTINPNVMWEPTVGVYVDGVFVAKNVGGLFDVAELERMEVLRGPQGTLYGKNTVGGAINLVTRKPGEEFGGTARVTVGNYNYSDVFLSVDSGKVGIASFNVAINKRDRDGFYDNTFSAPGVAKKFKELDSTAARLAALLDVSDTVELYYTFDISEKDNTPSLGQFDQPGDRLSRDESGALDGAKYDRSEGQGHAFHVTWDMNDELTFKSITAYRDMTFEDANDYDGQAAPYVGLEGQFHTNRTFETEQISQEFQLLGNYGDVNFVVGAYYFNENSDASNPFIIMNPFLMGGAEFTVGNQYGVDSESFALFGQADWAITDALTLTAGLRWTYEEKDAYLARQDPSFAFGGDISRIKANDSWSNVSPMAVLSYLWDNGINTYFKVSQGWKAGGFNGEAATQADFVGSYDEEKLTSYELGMKSRWFDNRLQANVAVFYDETKDMQVSHFLGAYSNVLNAGEAVVTGVEMDFIVQLSREIAMNLSYGYLDGEFKKFDGTGYNEDEAKFRYAPRHSATIGVDYVREVSLGEVRARLDYSYKNHHYIFDAPVNAQMTRISHYGLVNARVSLAEMRVSDKQRMEVGFWAKNITNEEYRINGIPVADATGTIVGAANYYGDPRTFGADVTLQF